MARTSLIGSRPGLCTLNSYTQTPRPARLLASVGRPTTVVTIATLAISAARVSNASTRMRQSCHAANAAATAPATAANASQSTSTPAVSAMVAQPRPELYWSHRLERVGRPPRDPLSWIPADAFLCRPVLERGPAASGSFTLSQDLARPTCCGGPGAQPPKRARGVDWLVLSARGPRARSALDGATGRENRIASQHHEGRGAMKVVERVAERLAHGVRGWMALGAVVLFALFTAMVLPAQAEAGAFYTVRYAAPDTSVWYSPDDLYAAAEAWGPEGRAAYVHARVTFAVIWPLVYGTFLLTTLAWVLARGTASGSRWRWVALLPVVAVALDYAENTCTATVMARYPARTPVLAELAPLFTAGKWLVLSASFLLLAIGLIIDLTARWRARSSRPPRSKFG